MSNKNAVVDIEARKKQLQSEIQSIQTGFEDTVDEVKSSVKSNVKEWSRPETWVKKYPFTSLVVAVTAGYVVGKAVSKNAGKITKSLKAPLQGDAADFTPMPNAQRPSKMNTFLQFAKPLAGRLWEQFGPAVLAYGEQIVAQKAAQMMQQQQEATAENEKASKKM